MGSAISTIFWYKARSMLMLCVRAKILMNSIKFSFAGTHLNCFVKPSKSLIRTIRFCIKNPLFPRAAMVLSNFMCLVSWYLFRRITAE